MDDTNLNSSSTSYKRKSKNNQFNHVLVVLGVGFVIATLFTAWADPNLLPVNFKENLTLREQASTFPEEIITPTARTKPLIGIVAGHSGFDSGAICPDGLTEVSVNQKISAYVQQGLAEDGINVEVLQEFDPKLKGYNATALISIHADSCNYINDQATGFKVASAFANPRPERSARLTACIRNRYAQVTGLPLHNSITPDMTSYHAFSEINNQTVAVIIEVGFLNLDRQILTQNPDIIADGIVASIMCFINNESIPTQINP